MVLNGNGTACMRTLPQGERLAVRLPSCVRGARISSGFGKRGSSLVVSCSRRVRDLTPLYSRDGSPPRLSSAEKLKPLSFIEKLIVVYHIFFPREGSPSRDMVKYRLKQTLLADRFARANTLDMQSIQEQIRSVVREYVELEEDVRPETMQFDTVFDEDALRSFFLVRRVRPDLQLTGGTTSDAQLAEWQKFTEEQDLAGFINQQYRSEGRSTGSYSKNTIDQSIKDDWEKYRP